MATIVSHPQHGKMFAYSQSEIDNLASLGWSVWVRPVKEDPVIEPKPETARRGRPRKA